MKKIFTLKQLPEVDKILLWTIMGLLVFGLISLSSASTVVSFQQQGSNYWYFLHQLLFGAIPGVIAMFILSRIDYHVWQKLSPLIMLIALGLLVAVLIPGIGVSIKGARRWIDVGAFIFQPGEIIKLATIFYLASWYDKRKNHLEDFYYGVLPIIILVVVISGLLIKQPDMGTMLVLISITICMLFLGGARLRHLAVLGGFGILTLWIIIKAESYRAVRLFSFFNPSHDSLGISYQINQALLAIGSGGLWGRGFGQSRQKYNYLPEPIGDSVFAVTAEELGFIRMTALLTIFLLFAFRGYKIAVNAPDTFGRLVAAGVTSWIVMQALINIAGITSLLPLTGIPLPFISYGSTALGLSLAGIGVLLNISRYATKKVSIKI